MRNSFTASERGFSIVEVLLSLSITTIVSLSLLSLINSQNLELRALTDKLLVKDLEMSLKNSLTNQSFCGCMMRGNTFNPISKTFNGKIGQVPSGYSNIPSDGVTPCTGTGAALIPLAGQTLPSSPVVVSNVNLSDITEVTAGSGIYTASLNVAVSDPGLKRALKGVTARFSFNLNTTSGTPTARPISTCSSINGAGAGVTVTSGNIGTWQAVRQATSADSSLPNCTASGITYTGGAFCYPIGGSCIDKFNPISGLPPSMAKTWVMTCMNPQYPYNPDPGNSGGGD